MKISTVATIVLLAFAPMAMAVVTYDSSTWESGYEMNGTPGVAPAYVAAEWTETTTGVAAANSVWSGTSLALGDGAASAWTAGWKISSGSPLIGATDWGIEWRIKLNGTPSHYQQIRGNGPEITIPSGTNAVQLITDYSSPNAAPHYTQINILPPVGHDSSVYHNYTIIGHGNGDGTHDIEVLVDNVTLYSQTSLLDRIDSSMFTLAFNYGSGGTGSNSAEFDHIRWTRQNVIPEPASLALLGLGGLMMLRRRR